MRSRVARYFPLFLLELRRSLRFALVLAALGLAMLLSSGQSAPAAPEIRNALARANGWTGLCLIGSSALLARAAGTLTRWRRGDADWLGSRPIRRSAALFAIWLALSCAGAGLFAAGAAIIERGSTNASALVFHRSLSARTEGRLIVVATGASEHFSWPRAELDLPAGARLRARVAMTPPGDPSTVAVLRLLADADTLVEVRDTIASRAWIELPVPDSTQDRSARLALELANEGHGTLALLAPRSFEVWLPGGAARRTSWRFAAELTLALAAYAALAIGFGAWVSTGTAFSGAFTVWLVLGAGLENNAWLPGSSLVHALGVLGEGRSPAAPGVRTLLGTLLIVALGLALARAGARSWRHSG